MFTLINVIEINQRIYHIDNMKKKMSKKRHKMLFA
jgi:hypothetical protein